MLSTTTDTLSRADILALPNRKRKTAHEWCSTCPFCGGVDRFLSWDDKWNYYCRHCEAKGFAVDSPNSLLIPPEKYEEWKREQEAIEAREREAQLSVLDRIARSPNADRYHHQMSDRSYWYGQGLTDETIDKFKFGYSSICPTYPASASWTIPIYYQSRLYNIRHRLASPGESGKYRPEMAGLPAVMFNADALNSGDWQIVLVEGEVKAAVLQQYGFTTVGIPGANSFKEKWVRLFKEVDGVVYVALDPGAEAQALKIGSMLASAGIETRVCTLPVKPDDFIVKYGGSPADLCKFLELGRRVQLSVENK